MAIKVDLGYLQENLEHHIERLDRSERVDKKYTTWITLYSAFSGAAIAAILGIAQFIPELETPLEIFAILLGATQAIINAYSSLFGHKRLWIIAAQSRRRFSRLREDLTHAEKTGSLNDDLLSDFYERYKEGLEIENSAWDELRERD